MMHKTNWPHWTWVQDALIEPREILKEDAEGGGPENVWYLDPSKIPSSITTVEIEGVRGRNYLYLDLNTPWNVDFLLVNGAGCAILENGEEQEEVDLTFSGGGISNTLRELRHIYFGEEGYIHSMDGLLVINAIKYLSKYFDDMTKK